MLPHLQDLFKRDLARLAGEISAYQSPENLWRTDGQISNSGGNLCLHLVGNLNTYIGGILGNSGYVRDRPAEFADRDVPVPQLLSAIAGTRRSVEETLAGLQPAQLEEIYPVQVFAEKMTTGYFLLHLTTHLAYHLGQINYHRRLLDQDRPV